eukprot:3377070-Amphidinium_carterae.2
MLPIREDRLCYLSAQKSPTQRSKSGPDEKAIEAKKRKTDLDAEKKKTKKPSEATLFASPSGAHAKGAVTGNLPEDVESSIISGRSSSVMMLQANRGLEEDIQPVIVPTKELRVMDDHQELAF